MRPALIALCCFLTSHALSAPPLPPQPEGLPWPTTEWPVAPLPKTVDRHAVASALAGTFDRHIGPAGHPDHRAIVAVHQGRIVIETYAPGFGPDNRFQSWSMAKSITNALIGILVREGRLSLDTPPPIEPWRSADDLRQQITLRHLMNMTAGLRDDGNAGNMLFAPDARRNAYARAAQVEIESEPGSQWFYSMASSNLLAGLASEMVGDDSTQVMGWVRRELLDPIGASNVRLEFDQTGHFIGGAFAWATARDWARLGYLFLRDGTWDGQRILPEGWVDFTRTRAPAANNSQYGAQFWLTAPAAETQPETLAPELEGFYMNGSQGQVVLIVPDRDLVVVHLGESHYVKWPEIYDLVDQIALAFPRIAQ